VLSVSASYYSDIIRILQEMGLSSDHMVRMGLCDIKKNVHPSTRVDIDALYRLLEQASTLLGQTHIGLNVSSGFRISTYGGTGNILAFCETIEQAGKLTQKYTCLVHTLGIPMFESTTHEDRVLWRSNYSQAEDNQYQQITEFVVANYVLSLNWLAWGFGQRVKKVTFRHAHTPPLSEYANILGCEVQFEAEVNSIAIEPGTFSRPLPTANPLKLMAMQQQLDRVLATYKLENTLILRVKQKIRELIEVRQPSLPLVSKELSLAERTLKRHLNKCDQSFNALVKSVKMELCDGYLKEGLPYSQIAQKLWYCDQSAFTRAFKNWHGVPPSIRASQLSLSR